MICDKCYGLRLMQAVGQHGALVPVTCERCHGGGTQEGAEPVELEAPAGEGTPALA